MTTSTEQGSEPRCASDVVRTLREEREPASEDVVEVARGVLRMQLPAPLPGIGHVNMYGLIDERGLAVVDPGLPGPAAWKAVEQRLASAGFAVRDVHTVLVTHSHIDHYGAAGHLAKAAGAATVTHAAFTTPMHEWLPERVRSRWAARRVEDDVRSLSSAIDHWDEEPPYDVELWGPSARDQQRRQHPRLVRTGWGTRRDLRSARRVLGMRLMTLRSTLPRPTSRVQHGRRVRLAGREWTCLHTPGHTVDHLCLYDPEDGVLLTGDHVLPTITPHVQGIRRGADAVGAYLEALELVATVGDVRIALPAHGHPIADLPGRVASITRHQLRRSARVRDAARALGPTTVVDLAHELYGSRYRGVASEAEVHAHLEHLVAAGRATRDGDRGTVRYRVVGE